MPLEPHEHWMDRCLALARLGEGAVSPNPMVGSVLVAPDGSVLGEGYHHRYGGPHAEPEAIMDAEAQHGAESLRTATLYVNLEPCSHHGKTPPCSDLIIEKGIPRVVAGMVDPNPRVAGNGIRRLQEHGVEVVVGVLEEACAALNEAFLHRILSGRPFVTLKIAQTLDGRIATPSGDSHWVTSPEARAHVHGVRSRMDAVLIGSGTALADDPELTVRYVEGCQPVRIVLDGRARLPAALRLFTDEHAALTVAVVPEGTSPAYVRELVSAGGRILYAPTAEGHLDLHAVLSLLGGSGGREGIPLGSILVEAGAGLATAFIREELANRLMVYIAPKLIGDGRSWLGDLGIARMADALALSDVRWSAVGPDLLLEAKF